MFCRRSTRVCATSKSILTPHSPTHLLTKPTQQLANNRASAVGAMFRRRYGSESGSRPPHIYSPAIMECAVSEKGIGAKWPE